MASVASTTTNTSTSTSTPRDASVEATRSRLIAAAAEVFAERGYDGTRVQEIARRAELTTGAIYANFTGKADLLLAAIDELGRSELDALILQDPPPASSIDMLSELGRRLATEGMPYERSLLFEAFGAARRDPEVKALLVDHLNDLGSMFRVFLERAQERGEVADDIDLDAAVRLCHSIALGYLVFEALDAPSPDPESWGELIGRLADSISSPKDQ